MECFTMLTSPAKIRMQYMGVTEQKSSPQFFVESVSSIWLHGLAHAFVT